MRRALLALSLLASTGCNLVIDPDGVEPPVPAATVTALAVTPATSSVGVGGTIQLTATATYSDGAILDVTQQATWSVVPAAFATVSDAAGTKGLVTAVAAGAATVSASFGGLSQSASVNVKAVSTVSVTGAPGSLPRGATRQLTATANFTDSTSEDVSATATWSSNDDTIATVSATGLVTATGSTGTATITATYAGKQGTLAITVAVPAIASVAVTPASPSVPKGATLQMVATATLTYGPPQVVTGACSWSSSAPGVASITTPAALVTGVAVTGTTTITANCSGVIGTTVVTAVAAAVSSIVVTPASQTLPKGATLQLAASAVYTDGSSVPVTNTATWSSSDPGVATVVAGGLVTGVGTSSSTTITASYLGKSGTATITGDVPALTGIVVAPAPLALPTGSHAPLTATGQYTDGSTQNLTSAATWTSSNAGFATVGNLATNKGIVRAVAQGGATITAASGGRSGTCAVTVGPVAIASLEISLETRTEKMPPGTRVIPSSIPLSTDKLQGIATVTYTDGRSIDATALATWTSSDPTVLDVSNTAPTRGLIETRANGPATLTVVFGGTTATLPATVRAPVVVWVAPMPGAMDIPLGVYPDNLKAMALMDDWTVVDITAIANWTSSNNGIVMVAAGGALTGVAAGAATVTATHPLTGAAGSTAIFVTSATRTNFYVLPNPFYASYGESRGIKALVDYSDGRTFDVSMVTAWSSSNDAMMTVDWEGQVTAHAMSGSANLTGVYQGQSVTVPATISIDGDLQVDNPPYLLVGGSLQARAYVYSWNTGERLDVTGSVEWFSNNPAVATVSSTGLITAVAPGGVSMYVRTTSGMQRWFNVTVKPAGTTINGVALTPATSPMTAPLGATVQFTAMASYSDGSSADATGAASWTNGGSTAVAFDPLVPGAVRAIAAGTAYVTASFGGVNSNEVQVNVTASPVTSIAVEPGTTSQPIGAQVAFKATATLQDASTIDVTNFATWWALQPELVNEYANPGLFSGTKVGSTQIAAALGSAVGLATFEVTPLAAVSLNPLSPPSPSVYVGTSGQLRAYATMTDGTWADVTEQATWSTSNGSIATVSNAAGSKGRVTGVAANAVTITATYGALAPQSTTFTVGAATPFTSIAISPNPIVVLAGGVYQASLYLMPGGTVNVAPVANWSSSSASSADVGNSLGNKGVVTGYVPGTGVATLTATYLGYTATATVNVVPPTMGAPTLRYVEWWDGFGMEPCRDGSYWSPTWPSAFDVQFFACSTSSSGRTYDVTEVASWSSDNSGVATASNVAGAKGRVGTVAAGAATVTANYVADGMLAVTVGSGTLSAVMSDGGPGYTHAGATDIVGVGSARVRAIYSDGEDRDVSRFATVTSSDPAIVSVGTGFSLQGGREIFGLQPGTVALTLGYRGKQTVNAMRSDDRPYLQLRAGIGSSDDLLWTIFGIQQVTDWISLPVGMSQRVWLLANDAIGLPWSAAEQATWSSSNPAVATVSTVAGSRGKVTAVAPGYTTISATVGSLTASVEVEVNAATLSALAVSPSYDLGPNGVVIGPFQATATYSDGATFDVTEYVTWPAGSFTAPQSTPGKYKINGTGLNTLSVSHGGSSASFRIVGFVP